MKAVWAVLGLLAFVYVAITIGVLVIGETDFNWLVQAEDETTILVATGDLPQESTQSDSPQDAANDAQGQASDTSLHEDEATIAWSWSIPDELVPAAGEITFDVPLTDELGVPLDMPNPGHSGSLAIGELSEYPLVCMLNVDSGLSLDVYAPAIVIDVEGIGADDYVIYADLRGIPGDSETQVDEIISTTGLAGLHPYEDGTFSKFVVLPGGCEQWGAKTS